MKHFYALIVAFFVLSVASGQCNYQLVLQDNFGSGWTSTPGAGVNVTINGGTPTFYTVQNAGATPNIVTFPISITNGDAVIFDYTPPSFSGDGQWRLLDSEGILVYDSGFNPNAAADFVGTAVCPTCPAVSNITFANVGSNTAQLTWTNGGSETEWEVEYGVSPYAVGSGGVIVTAPTNPFILTGLNSTTTYDVYMRSKCGPNDVGSSRGPVTFTTTESCPAPSNIVPVTNSANSISFIWNSNGNTFPTTNIQYGVSPYALNGPNGQTVTQFSAPFAEVTGLMSDTSYDFYIQIDCGGGDLSAWAGPYTNRTLISCPAVTALEASFIDSDNADITWNPGQSETAWELEYAIAGVITAPGTGQGTLVSLTSPSYNIPGLTDNTQYDVYVRGVCDPVAPDFSARRNISFVTQCLPIIATTASPYIETFETFAASLDFTRANCWSASFVNANGVRGYDWNVTTTGTTPSAGTGPNAANSGTRYFYIETLGVNGNTATLFSPIINIDGLTNPSVQFFYHLFGPNMGNLSVDVYDGTTWQTGLFTSSGPLQTAGSDPFEQAIIDLSGYSGNIQVRFVSTRTGATTGDMAIDDFSVQEAPACAPVSFLNTGVLNSTDAEITWQQQGSETAWLVEYGPRGFTPGTSATDPNVFEVTATTNPYIITGLTPSTNYDVYVSAACNGGLVSPQRGPRSFTTAFLPPQGVNCPGADNVFVFQEEFENNDNGWTGNLGVGTTTGALWNFNRATAPTSANTGPNGPFSGGGYAYLETSGTVTTPAAIVSPAIDLSFANSGAELSFYYFAYGIDVDEFKVNVGSSPTGPWTNVFTAIGQLQTSRTDAWAPVGVNLDAYVGQVIYLQITGKEAVAANFTGDIAIDLLKIETCGAFCSPPGQIAVANITDTTAQVSFTDTNSTAAGSFEIIVLPAGSPAPDASTTTGQQTVTASPYTYTGLTAFTDYDLYVRTNCGGASGFSVWSRPVRFQTACTTFVAPYFTNFENFTPTLLFVEENCWTADSDSAYDWNVDNNGSTPSAGTGPLRAFSGTTYFYIETNGGVNGDEARLVSPLVDITPLTTPSVQFKYHMFGLQTGTLAVDINDGTGWINNVFSLTGQQQTTQAEDWRDAIIDLSTVTLTSNVIRVRLRSIKAGVTTGDISIDDFRIDNIPTCPTPSALTVVAGSITQNGATADWTENGTATLYDLEWGPSGYTQGAPPAGPLGGLATDVAKPYTFTGLASSTVFDFYVRAKCGPGDVSFWAGPFSFQTLCGTISAPYFQDFESFTATTTLVEQVCWIASPTTGFTWDVSGTGTTGSLGTGPTAARSGTKFIFTEATSGTAGAVATIDSPLVDLTPLAAPSLQFYYHMFGNQIGTLNVQIDNGTGFVTVQTIGPGAQQPTQATEFYLQIINLAAYAGQTIKVRFSAVSAGTFEGDIAIDDFRIDELPSCPDPNLLTVLNTTDTTAQLSWSENGNATVWNVEVQLQGVPRGTVPAAAIVASASNPQVITGLLPNTSYDYYVRSECGPTDQSNWAGPFTFKTECAATPAPYTENFETFNATLLFVEQNCWKGSSNSTATNAWDWNLDNAGGTPTANTGPNAAFNGTNYFYIEGNGGAVGNEAYLFSPLVNLSALAVPSLQFHYHMFGADTGILRVDINDGTGFVNDVLVISGQQQTSGAAPWELAVVDLSAYASGTVQVRFRAERTHTTFTGLSDIAIDNVVFAELPACAQPGVLTSTNVTDRSASLSWNENSSATTWFVEYGPCGFAPGTSATGAVTVTANTNTNFIISGLSGNTCYDFYVRSDCGGGTTSSLVGPSTFTTACSAFVAPYSEGFESFAVTTAFVAQNCWSTPQTGAVFSWDTRSGTTPTINSGPSGAATGNIYFYTEASTGSAGNVAELLSPLVDISALTAPALTFNYHMFGADVVGLNVDINDGTGFVNNVFVLTGQQQAATTSPWLNAVVPLNAFAGSTIQIRFRVIRGASFNGDIAIDDIVVDNFNGCLTPNNLTLAAVASTSATINWTAAGGATVWEYVNQLAGTGTPTGAGTSTTVTTASLTGLIPATAYEFYVRADCGAGNFSSWVGPFNYTTGCAPFVAPYGNSTAPGNDFAVYPGTCWGEGNDTPIAAGPNGADGAWIADDFANLPGGPNGRAARINVWNNATINRDWLVTPEFDLGAPGHNFAANFDVALTDFAATTSSAFGSDDSVELLITADGGVTWSSIRSFNATTTISNTGQAVSVPLAAYSGVVRLAFWSTNGVVADTEDIDFFVDNFRIDGTAGVDSPAALGFSYYPNPTKDVINFNGIDTIDRIIVRNMLGQTINTINVKATTAQVDLSTYANGVYLIEVATAGRTSTVRAIKQ